MFTHSQEREYEQIKMQALMHGAEFKDEHPMKEGAIASKTGAFKFGDPDEDYKDMSQEEKETLTQKMMGRHKLSLPKRMKGQ